jgi:hypothetical protein
MKKFLSIFAVVLIATPALTFADSSIPIGQTITQMTTTVAALQALESAAQTGQPLTCALVFSAPKVSVGQQVSIGWGTVGALDPATSSSTMPMWTPDGGATLLFQTAGTWTYSYTFYGSKGGSITCKASIVVTK